MSAKNNKPNGEKPAKYTTGKTDPANMVSTPMGQTEKVVWAIAAAIVLVIAFFIIKGIASVDVFDQSAGEQASQQQNSGDESKAKNEKNLADKVQKALDKLGEDMKSTLASTSPEGYQGDIISVEPAAIDDTVKVNVSTYFEDSGDGIDGGQGIARRIFTNICLDVPELNSLYVVSGSGLESKSVYRSDFPFCK